MPSSGGVVSVLAFADAALRGAEVFFAAVVLAAAFLVVAMRGHYPAGRFVTHPGAQYDLE